MTTPGGYVAGDILTASDMNLLPAGTIQTASRTSNQVISAAGPTDITSLSVTFTAVAGRRYKITGHVDTFGVSAGALWVGLIRTSTATLSRFGKNSGDGGGSSVMSGCRFHVPGAGSVTYKLSLERISGAGSIEVNAGSDNLAFILVEDIGPS